jgi:hypothetical protein
MKKNKLVLRRLLTQRLVALGVDKQMAHHEVGFMMNRRDPEEVVSAIMLHASNKNTIRGLHERLNLSGGGSK